jgi:hypothetical protein
VITDPALLAEAMRSGQIDAVNPPFTTDLLALRCVPGLKPVDNLLFFPGEEGYRPDFARWEYDPTEALALLKRHCTGGPAAPDPATTKVWQCRVCRRSSATPGRLRRPPAPRSSRSRRRI